MTERRYCWPLGLACVLAVLRANAAEPSKPVELPPAATKKIDFETDIRPIFAKSCFECHGPQKQRSGFRLDQKAAALQGGDLGPAIIPGNSAESPLVQYVAG